MACSGLMAGNGLMACSGLMAGNGLMASGGLLMRACYELKYALLDDIEIYIRLCI